MGTNFTYNSSEFGQGDVYTTIKTYLSPGKMHFFNEWWMCIVGQLKWILFHQHNAHTNLMLHTETNFLLVHS